MYILSKPSTRAPGGEVYFTGQIASLISASDDLVLVGGEGFFEADARQFPLYGDACVLIGMLDRFAVNERSGWRVRRLADPADLAGPIEAAA